MVRCTFSPARAWRRVVGPASTRTLGHAEMSRANIAPILSCRTRRPAKFGSAPARKSEEAAEQHAELEGTANTDSGTGFARAKAVDDQHHQQTAVAHGREERQSTPLRHHCAELTLGIMQSPCSQPRGARKEIRSCGFQAAVATCPAPCLHMPRNSPHSQLRASAPAWPNPSLKRSANGRPPSPGRWYSVHFHRPGLGVLPSSPA